MHTLVVTVFYDLTFECIYVSDTEHFNHMTHSWTFVNERDTHANKQIEHVLNVIVFFCSMFDISFSNYWEVYVCSIVMLFYTMFVSARAWMISQMTVCYPIWMCAIPDDCVLSQMTVCYPRWLCAIQDNCVLSQMNVCYPGWLYAIPDNRQKHPPYYQLTYYYPYCWH